MKQPISLKGFTLVELSIVLVIIGLLIGGILVGQSLIESSKITAQIKQIQEFDIAVSNFKAKFKQIPADCSICAHGNGALNGNNNKIIGEGTSTTPAHLIYDEAGHFFPDLSKMGMISESYVTVNVRTTFNIGIGKQFPKAKLGKAGIWAKTNYLGQIYYAYISKDSSQGGNVWPNCAGGFMCDRVLTPEQAAGIDSKLDDGIPTTGDITTVGSWDVSNTIIPFEPATSNGSSCNLGTKYNLNLSTVLCNLTFKSTVSP